VLTCGEASLISTSHGIVELLKGKKVTRKVKEALSFKENSDIRGKIWVQI
jgi:hypothetical protein